MKVQFDSYRYLKTGLHGIGLGLVLTAISFWGLHRLPPPSSLSVDLADEPQQTQTLEKPFVVERGGCQYRLEPLYNYDIKGLVVAQHDSSSWNDISHKEWHDFLNTRDICVIWGLNTKNDYRQLSFSHGDFTCYVSSGARETWQKFKLNQISNNHMLPATDAIARAIASTNVGDQVQWKGFLVNYQIGDGPARNTSTTREDTGPGACEIVYVTEFTRLVSPNKKWASVYNLGLFLTAAGAALALFAMAVPLLKN